MCVWSEFQVDGAETENAREVKLLEYLQIYDRLGILYLSKTRWLLLCGRPTIQYSARSAWLSVRLSK